jgi:hypothetical protein
MISDSEKTEYPDRKKTEWIAQALKDYYNSYRTAFLSKEYYGRRLDRYLFYNKSLELILAISTSSAIGSWAIWKSSIGDMVWATLAAISALIAVIKPILNLQRNIERYSKLFIGHQDAYYDLEQIIREVKISQNISEEMGKEYQKILFRIRKLASKHDPKLNQKLLNKIYDEINKTHIPPNSLWMPMVDKS